MWRDRRYASLKNIMNAKRKPMEKKMVSDYQLDLKNRLETIKVEGEWW